MSFLTKLFGKATAEAEQKNGNDNDPAAAAVPTKIYPMLKPGSWDGLTHGVLKTTLVGTADEPEVIIGYGHDTPGNFVFLTLADLGKYAADDIINQALANLNDFPSAFEEFKAPEGKILTASGQAYSSEKILCPAFMQEAHQLLGSRELLVSIPRRTCLMAISKNDNKELLAMFLSLHDHVWQDDTYDNEPISQLLFVVIDGVIAGSLPLD